LSSNPFGNVSLFSILFFSFQLKIARFFHLLMAVDVTCAPKPISRRQANNPPTYLITAFLEIDCKDGADVNIDRRRPYFARESWCCVSKDQENKSGMGK
jgi:hypothetical protein